jgi:hypothetical protein
MGSGWPIIGSVLDVPEKLGWIKFHEWGEQYGPIYQVNLAGYNHVWICRDDIARHLMAKKGAIYSGRPHIPALLVDNRTSHQYLPLMGKTGKCVLELYSYSLMEPQTTGLGRESSQRTLCETQKRHRFTIIQSSKLFVCVRS